MNSPSKRNERRAAPGGAGIFRAQWRTQWRTQRRTQWGSGWRVRPLRLAALVLALGVASAAWDRVWPRGGSEAPGPVTAEVLAVIDGDTIDVRALIWIDQNVETRVRLAGVDTPELRGKCDRERDLAMAARAFVIDAVGGTMVTLDDVRYDKYGGRVLARVRTVSGEDLATLIIAAGLGRAYAGGKRDDWCGGKDKAL